MEKKTDISITIFYFINTYEINRRIVSRLGVPAWGTKADIFSRGPFSEEISLSCGKNKYQHLLGAYQQNRGLLSTQASAESTDCGLWYEMGIA